MRFVICLCIVNVKARQGLKMSNYGLYVQHISFVLHIELY